MPSYLLPSSSSVGTRFSTDCYISAGSYRAINNN